MLKNMLPTDYGMNNVYNLPAGTHQINKDILMTRLEIAESPFLVTVLQFLNKFNLKCSI